MKVLVIGNGSTGVDSYGRGFINKHTGNFLYQLNKRFNVSFCQFGTVYDINSDLSSYSLSEAGIDFTVLPSLKNPISLFKALLLVLKSDFVYLFFPGNLSRVFGVLSFFTFKKYGIYLRGQYFSEFWFDRILIKKASFILTVSPSFKELLRGLNLNVEIIKPMIDISLKDLFLDDRKFDINYFRILTVGRVEYRKGTLELIDTAKLLKEHGFSFRWDVVGGGDLLETGKEMVFKWGLENYVYFHGQVSDKNDLNNFYKKSDLFVFLSHDEGFPRVLYEAMAFKLPIFTTFVGGIPGRMINGINCFKLPISNPEDAFNILVSHINYSKVLQMIGAGGQLTLIEILNGSTISHEELFFDNFTNVFVQ